MSMFNVKIYISKIRHLRCCNFDLCCCSSNSTFSLSSSFKVSGSTKLKSLKRVVQITET